MAAANPLPQRQQYRDPAHLLEYSDFNRSELYSRGDASRSKIPTRLPSVTAAKATTWYASTGKLPLLQAIIMAIATEGNQENIVALLASAVQLCTSNNVNMLGLNTAPVQVNTINDAGTGVRYSDVGGTETFIISPEISVPRAELERLNTASEHEMYFYVGILMVAAVKEPTNDNHTAFTAKRVKALQSRTDDPLVVFETGSIWTNLDTFRSVHKAFNAYGNRRANLILSTARLQQDRMEGPAGTFFMNFKLLEDYGFGQLTLIKMALASGDWVRDDFPELRAERRAWMNAVRCIMAADEGDRPFLKAAYGDQFVPAEQGSMNMLLGQAKEIMSRFDPRWRRFGGGRLTDAQMNRINLHMGDHTVIIDELAEV